MEVQWKQNETKSKFLRVVPTDQAAVKKKQSRTNEN